MNYEDQVGEALGKCESIEAKREPDKPWNECGIEEKVERLRHELIGAREMGQVAYRNAREARELAARHQHAVNGEVLRPAERNSVGLSGEGRGFDPLR